MKHLLIWVAILTLPMSTSAQREVQYYLDSNLGLAFIDMGFFFPGISMLGGVRKVSSSSTFFESEIGLAAPALVTAKAGVGYLNERTGGSTSVGLRLWPLHAYVQQAFGTRRCEREVPPRTSERLQRKGRDRSHLRCSDWYFTVELGTAGNLSFDSIGIISIGHRLFFD